MNNVSIERVRRASMKKGSLGTQQNIIWEMKIWYIYIYDKVFMHFDILRYIQTFIIMDKREPKQHYIP